MNVHIVKGHQIAQLKMVNLTVCKLHFNFKIMHSVQSKKAKIWYMSVWGCQIV